MESKRKNRTVLVTVLGSTALAVILIGGIFLMAGSAHRDATDAAHSVSLLYLDELAGRREQVVEDKLNSNIQVIRVALEMLDDEDLSDLDHLRNYQRRVKRFSTWSALPSWMKTAWSIRRTRVCGMKWVSTRLIIRRFRNRAFLSRISPFPTSG